jgi:hypothetical protein
MSHAEVAVSAGFTSSIEAGQVASKAMASKTKGVDSAQAFAGH